MTQLTPKIIQPPLSIKINPIYYIGNDWESFSTYSIIYLEKTKNYKRPNSLLEDSTKLHEVTWSHKWLHHMSLFSYIMYPWILATVLLIWLTLTTRNRLKLFLRCFPSMLLWIYYLGLFGFHQQWACFLYFSLAVGYHRRVILSKNYLRGPLPMPQNWPKQILNNSTLSSLASVHL